MHFLVFTGQLARAQVQDIVVGHAIPAKVIALPVSVASFMTPNQVRRALRKENLAKVEFALLPGNVSWDAGDLEAEFNLNIRKGPRNIDDLPHILASDVLDQLSPRNAADRLLSNQFNSEFDELVKKSEATAQAVGLPRNFSLSPSQLLIGMDAPPRIIAQVMNATEIPIEEVVANARFFATKGVSIIDVGGVVHAHNPERIAEVVSRVRAEVNLPIAVDSINPAEIVAAVTAGAELVLSIDLGNVSVLEGLPTDVAVVIVPTNVAGGISYEDPRDRVRVLCQLTRECRQAGFEKILADPLLGAPIQPGFVSSLAGYFLFRHPESSGEAPEAVPLLLGAENVVEMVDMDSPGVNGLLASVAVELQAGAILTTEFSPKTQNSIAELQRGIQMAYMARAKRVPPKDLGVTLLTIKSKAKNALPPELLTSAVPVTSTEEDFIPDPAGYFKIFSNYRTGQVIAAHFANTQEMLGIYTSDSAESLYKYLLTQGMVTRLDHSAYLGRELGKAEFCAKTGGNYYQED